MAEGHIVANVTMIFAGIHCWYCSAVLYERDPSK